MIEATRHKLQQVLGKVEFLQLCLREELSNINVSSVHIKRSWGFKFLKKCSSDLILLYV